jgi:hypothetical protein
MVIAGAVLPASPPSPAPKQEAPQGQALLDIALANEQRAAQDLSHPMRYLLRKSSPRLTVTRRIYETKEGAVARLLSSNDKPLSLADDQREDARLAQLASDPGRQRRRKQGEDADRARVVKALRNLPAAFVYQDAGPVEAGGHTVERFTFKPNPSYSPPDIEMQVLTQVAGEIWIDPVQQRAVHLEGKLQSDVDFGWGILGRLYKGGWIKIDQADLGGGTWRIVRLQMAMNARVVWRTRNFDTLEEESEFAPLPEDITYKEAVAMLLGEQRASR